MLCLHEPTSQSELEGHCFQVPRAQAKQWSYTDEQSCNPHARQRDRLKKSDTIIEVPQLSWKTADVLALEGDLLKTTIYQTEETVFSLTL